MRFGRLPPVSLMRNRRVGKRALSPVFARRQKQAADADQFNSVKYNFPVRHELNRQRVCLRQTRAGCKAGICFTVNSSSLHMSADVTQINNAVQEVNDLARKNKDSIEGLAAEVRKFKV